MEIRDSFISQKYPLNDECNRLNFQYIHNCTHYGFMSVDHIVIINNHTDDIIYILLCGLRYFIFFFYIYKMRVQSKIIIIRSRYADMSFALIISLSIRWFTFKLFLEIIREIYTRIFIYITYTRVLYKKI